MSECDHTVDDIDRVATRGLIHHDDGEVTVRAKCECGAPTAVTADIRDVVVVDDA